MNNIIIIRDEYDDTVGVIVLKNNIQLSATQIRKIMEAVVNSTTGLSNRETVFVQIPEDDEETSCMLIATNLSKMIGGTPKELGESEWIHSLLRLYIADNNVKRSLEKIRNANVRTQKILIDAGYERLIQISKSL